MGWDTDRDFAGTPVAGFHSPIHAELAPGERVAWEGQPRIGRQVLGTLPMLLFGLPFTALPVFVLGAMSRLEPGPVGILVLCFALPFLVIGVCLLGSPLWAAWKATQTHYAVTNRRAILCEPQLIAGLQIRSYPPEALGSLVRNQRGDGSGDLIFEEIRTRNHEGHTRTTRRGFFGIDRVRDVENLIRTTLLPQRVAS